MTAQKKKILKIAMGILGFLLIMTMISGNVDHMLMPKVEIVRPGQVNTLQQKVSCRGVAEYVDEISVAAEQDYCITAVCVQKGQQVRAGDVLYEVAGTENDITRKKLELTVLEKQDQITLEQQKMETELARLDGEIAIAQKQLEAYNIQEEELLQLKQLQQAWFSAKNQLNREDLSDTERAEIEVQVRVAETELHQYTRLHDLDIEVSTLQLNLLEKQNQKKEAELSYQLNLKEWKQEKAIAEMELQQYCEKYPEDGTVKAREDGIITQVDVSEPGEVLMGTGLYSIAKNGKVQLIWNLSYDAGLLFGDSQTAQIRYRAFQQTTDSEGDLNMSPNDNMVATDVFLTDRVWDAVENQWQFTADGTGIDPGTAVDVVMSTEPRYYDYVFPLSCLYQNGEGMYCIRIVESRKGLFSEERFIEEVPVELLEYNDLYAAVSSDRITADSMIVHYTNKALQAGTVVEVTNE